MEVRPLRCLVVLVAREVTSCNPKIHGEKLLLLQEQTLLPGTRMLRMVRLVWESQEDPSTQVKACLCLMTRPVRPELSKLRLTHLS